MSFLKNFLSYKKYQFLKYKKYSTHFNKDKETSTYIRELKKKGFVVINNYFESNTCKEIIKIIDDFIINKPEMYWKDPLQSDVRIHGAENISLRMKEFVDKKISFTQHVGERYLNQKIGLYMLMANRTIFKHSNLGSGQGWHKDAYSKQFKSIIYLTDVTEENGPFQIIENSNSNLFMLNLFFKLKNKYPSTRFTNEDIDKILDGSNNKVIELTGKAGTLIMFDTSYIHRGKPLQNAKRYALTNYFYPQIDFPNHKDHFLPILDKI